MSRRYRQWRESPPAVTVRRRGSRFVATARTYARSLGGERIYGFGTDGLGALKNLFCRWMDLTKLGVDQLPYMRVLPPESRATEGEPDDTVSMEIDPALIGPGTRPSEHFMVRATRDGRLQLGVLRWRRRSTVVRGRRVDYERRDFIAIGEIPLSRSMIHVLWSGGRYARERALLTLARRAAVRLAVKRVRYLPFGKTEAWTRDGAAIVLVCAADNGPWGTALQVRFGYDQTVEICRQSYRIVPLRSDADRASIVPSLSAWTVSGRHTLDLQSLKKLKPAERVAALRVAFWESVNPALSDPFVYVGHALITGSPTLLPAPLAERIEAALTDLVLVDCPHGDDVVWLEYLVEFHPEPRVLLPAFSEDNPTLRAKIKETLDALVAEADLSPMGRFTTRETYGTDFLLSEWCRTTETCYLRISLEASAHRRLLAHRRVAAMDATINDANPPPG